LPLARKLAVLSLYCLAFSHRGAYQLSLSPRFA
jgi:hypothetical protein